MIQRSTILIFAVLLSVCGSVYSAGALIWSDEFETGDRPSSTTWTYDVGGGGWGNGQLEYNTARRENSYIENGNLVIEARREFYQEATANEFTSARMLTQGRFAFKYGTLEARIKMPDVADGLWPAFWMLGNNFDGIPWPECGEVDIVEIGSKAGIDEGLQNRKMNAAIHYDTVDDRAYDPGTYAFDAGWIDANDLLNLDYHLYKLVWTPAAMTAYLDGDAFWSFDITAPYLKEFHQPHYPILNIAVGSWPTGYTGISTPAGITAPFPAKMYVDYIRLYSHPDTEIYLAEQNEESGGFGIYTETTPVNNSLTFIEEGQEGPDFNYGNEAVLYIWNNLTEATPPIPSEGSECWSFDAAPGTWYGMGVFVPAFRNMKNYSDGYLHMDMATTTSETIKVGIKSSVGGESWLELEPGADQFGLVRDGDWHEVRIPLNRFSNTDFQTIHQLLMIAGDPPASTVNLSIDNVWWEPSVPKQVPENGNFGVYTEDTSHKDAGEFVLGTDGDFFVWADTLNDIAQTPYEGAESVSLQSAPGLTWFGCAFTPNIKYNLTAFRYPESKLCFALKTSSSTTFRVGMKSGNIDGIGQKWIQFEAGSDPYGFVRDGQWHGVEIPMSDFITEVDLSEVSQFFEILGVSGAISDIEFDDIYFTGGGEPNIIDNIPPSVSIISPENGSFFDPNDNVIVTADASDSDGIVTKVEFYEGINYLGEDLTAPYTYTWNTIPEGQYVFRAKATDDDGDARMSLPVTIYVGSPRLTSVRIIPSVTSVEEGKVTHFVGRGYDQFGQEFQLPAGLLWSVSGGGVIDENGSFVAVEPNEIPYVVTAVEAAGGILSDTAGVQVFTGGLCTGQPANGDYTWEASGIAGSPTITFIPSGPGIGDTTLLLYYSTNPAGVFPGYIAQAGVPYPITNAVPGQTVYFYHTYNVPGGGQHTTYGDVQSFEVGNCPPIIASDFDGSGSVDILDLETLAFYWLETGCEELGSCEGADHVGDGDVDMHDLHVLAYNWLRNGSGVGPGDPPTVSITSPAEGSVFDPNDVITIEADAADLDGIVVRVEFFEGDNYLGQDLAAPYSFVWVDANSVPEGQYVLTAVAVDDDGHATVSEPVTIRIGTPAIVNVIANGGFELGTGTNADVWTENKIGTGTLCDRSSESPYSEVYSMKLLTNWQSGGGVKAEILQTVTGLSAGADYDFAFWIKGLMGPGGVAWAEIKWFNESSIQVGGTGLINLFSGLSNTTYQQQGGTYTTPAGTAGAQISIRVEGGALAALNTLYVDEVSLIRVY